MLERFFAFLARHPRGVDVVVAAFWTFLTVADDAVIEDPNRFPFLIPFLLLGSIGLIWRRSHPFITFGVLAGITIVMTFLDVAGPVPAALICACYSLGAHASERRVSIAMFVGFLVTGFSAVLVTDPQYIPDTLLVVLLLSIAWVIGDSLRTRRLFQQTVLERAERAEALRDSLAQQAVAQERTRIARDLHDVVAHSMSLMVVQAAAARRVAATDPAASAAALEAIETVGRNSLDEMRRILGVLRGDEAGHALAPQPDIAAIETLVDEFRSAGLRVTMTKTGVPRPLSPSVELTAYRIVQESLTNTLRHAGPSVATVRLDFAEEELRIQVEDDGSGTPSHLPSQSGSQKGHVGMHERIIAFGGSFTARDLLGGGYHVSATIPLADAVSAAASVSVSVSAEGAS